MSEPSTDPSLEPGAHSRLRGRSVPLGVLVLLLVLTCLAVGVYLTPDQYRLAAAALALGIAASAVCYALGRARSRTLEAFYPRERLGRTGETVLGNPYGIISMVLLLLAALVILLPSQFGARDSGAGRGGPPAKAIKTPVRVVEIPYGIPTAVDKREWYGFENTNAHALDALQKLQPAAKGYHWVLFYLTVTPKERQAEFYAASTSLKMLDDKNGLQLPDYGAGIVNADQSYVREKTRPYWTVAYQVADGRKPKGLQIEVYPGIDQLLLLRPATRLEFCQQFAKARAADVAAHRKPVALPADCPGLLAAQTPRTAAEVASPANSGPDPKTTAPTAPNPQG
jgi:hypothetical protein